MASAVLVNDNYEELPPVLELPKLVRTSKVRLLPEIYIQRENIMSYQQCQMVYEGIISQQDLIDTFGDLAYEKYIEAVTRYERRRILEEKIPLHIRQDPGFIIDAYINDENDKEVQ